MKEIDMHMLYGKRLELIQRLEHGELTKETFILENYKILAPYKRLGTGVRTIREGVMKYHYFNTLAKKMMLDAGDITFRDPRGAEKLKEQAYDLYVKKDQVTLKLLEILEYKGLDAYYIFMNSKQLEGHIYEIDCLEHEKVVLHSKDRKILHKLRNAGCFSDEKRPSKIQSYVNTKL
ncbi:DUF6648 family protein [Fusibacter sp. JL298sf-3]